AAAPLAGHTTGSRAFLGEATGVEDEDGLGSAEFLADVVAEFAEDGLIVPAAGADEQLQRSALLTGLGGDRFGSLAFQARQLAAQDGARVRTVLRAQKAGQVAG